LQLVINLFEISARRSIKLAQSRQRILELLRRFLLFIARLLDVVLQNVTLVHAEFLHGAVVSGPATNGEDQYERPTPQNSPCSPHLSLQTAKFLPKSRRRLPRGAIQKRGAKSEPRPSGSVQAK